MPYQFGKTILLVEDEALIAMAEKRVLESAGYTVTVGHTGEEALQIVSESYTPDLVLMDIDLGSGMDGTETAERILKQVRVPIVFLSSQTDPDIVARTEKMTSYGYIHKNSDDTILLASIRMAFELWDAHQKAAEAESHAFMQQKIIEAIRDAVIVTDATGVVTYHNSAAASLYGFRDDSAVGSPIGTLIRSCEEIGAPDGRRALCSIVDYPDWRGELVVQAMDGKTFTVSVSNYPLADAVGSTHAIVSLSRRLHYGRPFQAEGSDHYYLERELKALIQSDPTIFTFLREGSLDGMWYWDLERPDQEWMDNRFWELFGYDPKTKRHDPAEWQELIHPEDLQVALDNFHKHLKDPTHPYDQVVRYTHSNGSTVYVRCRGLAIRDKDGRPLRMLGVHNDITELMKTITTEKTLRHELNHRVKNNLAIVTSLISLQQQESIGATDLSEILHRVDTIRVLHEQLQASDDLTRLELTPYLKSIVSSVFDSTVRVDIGGIDVEVNSEVAVSLGLVVNELATNAVKHGFTDGYEKRFMLNLDALANTSDRIRVKVSNTGPPFPPDVDVNTTTSLGLRLISSLVEQLDSHLTITREPHPSFQFDVQYHAVLVAQ